MKKAYIIVAHKNPAQLVRLMNRLNDGLSHFFIHIDSKTDLSTFKDLDRFGDIIVHLDRFHARWGRYGIVLPLLNGLRAVKNHKETFDRIIVLSGQDYPIKSNKAINDFLSSAQHSVYIDHFPLPNLEKWPGADRGGMYRIDKYYFGGKTFERICSKGLNFLASHFGSLKRKVPLKMTGFAGSAWMILDMYALNYILDFHEAHPEYLKFHKNTFVADEVFIQMIVGNTNESKLSALTHPSNQHFMIWESSKSAHPKSFEKSDFESINSSPLLFARKFDEEVDAEILDLIDEKILFR